MTNPLTTQLIQTRVVPVLRYTDAETALYAADIAVRAGFEAIELTWTIPDVLDVLQTLRKQHGTSILLGVGTLMNADQARAVLNAGADFLVSPGLATDMVAPAHEAGKLCLVGAFTPSEVMAAIRAEADVVKIFPADTGGPAHLAALRAVFSSTVFCPTGGLSAKNMHDYFQAGASFVGIGSSLYDKKALAARDTDGLLASVRSIREAAHGKHA
ncbi:bifunctional 4-hydroxy-2-oxoglutarate aldolase/2-dehydro-3-deoxy-phosphogluconate aldolase [Bordetella tumulicola]|uniref:bifunctional 4-hydroxy-2-oxoglutarate aldolase/2-dehydro-3-deoxy-phosphogluconate aldolase n=1 Tax=Bordetella tumulicola TaxID=1649133 RepID=UPI0039EE9CF3